MEKNLQSHNKSVNHYLEEECKKGNQSWRVIANTHHPGRSIRQSKSGNSQWKKEWFFSLLWLGWPHQSVIWIDYGWSACWWSHVTLAALLRRILEEEDTLFVQIIITRLENPNISLIGKFGAQVKPIWIILQKKIFPVFPQEEGITGWPERGRLEFPWWTVSVVKKKCCKYKSIKELQDCIYRLCYTLTQGLLCIVLQLLYI